ncbi:MAG: hypothetical protein IJY14_02985 [Acholeplasmatales bacterium]|nr:hypothetical protein [Acholeplasmatales bacterium]
MKKFCGIFVFIIFSILLMGCSNNEEVNTDEEMISYITENGAKIYSLNFDILNLDIDDKIDDINQIDYDNEYTILVIKSISYDYMTKDVVNQIHDKLRENQKFMVIYLYFPDFNFYEGTKEANEKNFYPANSEVDIVLNFGEFDSVRSYGSSMYTNEEYKDMRIVLNAAYKNISKDIGKK